MSQFYKELNTSDNGKGLLKRYEHEHTHIPIPLPIYNHLLKNILLRLSRRNGSTTYPDCAIYEVGGNIGKFMENLL